MQRVSFLSRATFLSAVVTVAGFAGAAPVTVSNFSFENPSTGGFTQGFGNVAPASNTAITDWGAFVSNGAQNYGTQSAAANSNVQNATGSQIAFLNRTGNEGPIGLYQTVGSLLPNTTYTLTVDIGRRGTGGFGSVDDLEATFSLVNGTDQTGATLVTSGPTIVPNPALSAMSTAAPITFTTGSSVSGQLTIVLANTTSAADGFAQLQYDNIRLDATAVPEPTSLALVGAGAVLATRRRRV